ncbi:MAG TPA: hypothetical protein EYH46_07970 [Sulfurivirga caldicuralii]|nr:hypothetical protein [Sulfurivirga caldicuralii]
MNELQITLLILAVIFITVLYFLGQRRKQSLPAQQTNKEQKDASVQQHNKPQAAQTLSPDIEDRIYEENGKLVIEVDGDQPIEPIDTGETRTNFGRPSADAEETAQTNPSSQTAREPQLFAIMVLGTQPYDARTIRHALIALGMRYDEKEQIFVLKNEAGQIYLRAANAWNPGTLPDNDDQADFETPGVALILELPTCIPAPAAMEDMIKLARKLSQRLRAHLYRMDRQHMTESDIRAMRQAALDYVSEPLKSHDT